MSSDVTTSTTSVGPDASRRRRKITTQNAGLWLAVAMLAGTVASYSMMYVLAQARLPGSFELTSALNTALPLALTGIAQTIVVTTRGIDLSVGGMVDLSNAIAARYMGATFGSEIGCSVLVLCVGAAAGLFNGVVVVYGRLQPILVTLGTLSILQGVAIWVLPQPGGEIPTSYTNVLASADAPWSLIFYVLAVGFWSVLRRTTLGIGLFALGNDEAASRANGVNIRRVRVQAYMLSGIISAAAGLFLVANTTGGDATAGDSYTLNSIVATVLGGVSLFGGRGSGIGAVIGAITATTIVNVLFFAHVNPLYQSFYEGLLLVAAVVLVESVGHKVRSVAR